MIRLSEIFSSIQGEGPFMGRPATFVRLSGCIQPLCPWCDTIYACGPGEKISMEDIFLRVSHLGKKRVVITGGEPFLQWESGVKTLEARFLDKGFSIQYETGGKIVIPSDSKGFKVCSPKYIDHHWHFMPENIHRADCFKFVVKDEYSAVKTFVNRHKIPREKVWIMPLGAVREEQLDRSPSIWKFCVDNRFNFSPRLHTLTFNNIRGI